MQAQSTLLDEVNAELRRVYRESNRPAVHIRIPSSREIELREVLSSVGVLHYSQGRLLIGTVVVEFYAGSTIIARPDPLPSPRRSRGW